MTFCAACEKQVFLCCTELIATYNSEAKRVCLGPSLMLAHTGMLHVV